MENNVKTIVYCIRSHKSSISNHLNLLIIRQRSYVQKQPTVQEQQLEQFTLLNRDGALSWFVYRVSSKLKVECALHCTLSSWESVHVSPMRTLCH